MVFWVRCRRTSRGVPFGRFEDILQNSRGFAPAEIPVNRCNTYRPIIRREWRPRSVLMKSCCQSEVIKFHLISACSQ